LGHSSLVISFKKFFRAVVGVLPKAIYTSGLVKMLVSIIKHSCFKLFVFLVFSSYMKSVYINYILVVSIIISCPDARKTYVFAVSLSLDTICSGVII
jgi:hypothetical protein